MHSLTKSTRELLVKFPNMIEECKKFAEFDLKKTSKIFDTKIPPSIANKYAEEVDGFPLIVSKTSGIGRAYVKHKVRLGTI